MQVSPPAVKLQYTLKESPEHPWLGSIQYSPKTNEKLFALCSGISIRKIHVLLLPQYFFLYFCPPKFIAKLFYLNDEKATLFCPVICFCYYQDLIDLIKSIFIFSLIFSFSFSLILLQTMILLQDTA